MLPFTEQQLVGVRRVFQGVVLLVHVAFFHRLDFAGDGDHGIAEAVEFALAFGLRGFDHQRIGHRKAHCRRVEAVVHQTLGHILHTDAGAFLQVAQVDDAFMCHITSWARVKHRKMW